MYPEGQQRESGVDSPSPDIVILAATAFHNHYASDETMETYALQIGECSGLLEATMDVTQIDKSLSETESTR